MQKLITTIILLSFTIQSIVTDLSTVKPRQPAGRNEISTKHTLRPVASGAVSGGLSIDGENTAITPNSEYGTIWYRNGSFSTQKVDDVKKRMHRVKLKRFLAVMGSFAVLLFSMNYLSAIFLGTSLLSYYIAVYNNHEFLVAGVTASLIGSVSEMTGLYFSDNPSQKHRLVSRFIIVSLIRLFIFGPTSSALDSFIESAIPQATATSLLLFLRMSISFVHGVFLASLIQVFVPYFYQKSYARAVFGARDPDKTQRILENFTIKRQIGKTVQSIKARIAPVIIQHDIIQNIFYYQPAYQIVARFGLGYLTGLLRSWFSNTKKPEAGAKPFAYVGFFASIISWIWGSKLAALGAVLISTAMYISAAKNLSKSERLCRVLNIAKRSMPEFTFGNIEVSKSLKADIIRKAVPGKDVSYVLSETCVQGILQQKDLRLAAKSLAAKIALEIPLPASGINKISPIAVTSELVESLSAAGRDQQAKTSSAGRAYSTRFTSLGWKLSTAFDAAHHEIVRAFIDEAIKMDIIGLGTASEISENLTLTPGEFMNTILRLYRKSPEAEAMVIDICRRHRAAANFILNSMVLKQDGNRHNFQQRRYDSELLRKINQPADTYFEHYDRAIYLKPTDITVKGTKEPTPSDVDYIYHIMKTAIPQKLRKLKPIIACRPDGKFMLIHGRKKLRAAERLGLEYVPVILIRSDSIVCDPVFLRIDSAA